MKVSSNKIFIIVISILVITLIIAFIYKANELNEYSKKLLFMNNNVNVKIYTTNEIKANKVFDEIQNIYNEYEKLIDYKTEYEGNLYSLNNGSDSMDYRLHKLIEYGYIWSVKSNGILNITLGNLYEFKDTMNDINNTKEITPVFSTNMTDILVNEVISDNIHILVDKSVILSNGVKLYLNNISKGYVNEIVAKYLKDNGITKYMINDGDNIYLGEQFKNKPYSIAVVNPIEDMIYKVIKGSNIAISNIDKKSNIIDPKTYDNPNYIAGVTVIANNSMDASALANILFLMDPDSGLEFVKDYDAEVIWFLNDDTIKTTKGISKYE